MSDNPWIEVVRDLTPGFAERAAKHDADDSFVAENFALLKEKKVLSAMVPAELGGGGASHGDMCEVLRELARACSSTALALAMHQHLVGFQRYNHQHGKPGGAVLEKVAAQQLLLVSTGARDYLASAGEMKKVEGGFEVHARKAFASGSPSGDVLLTSAPYRDPTAGWQVLHFSVPLKAKGVRIDTDWRAMGMRGSGSHTVLLEGAFVPEAAVGLRRPRGAYHPVWSVILTQALPLITAVYVGVAEAAGEIVRAEGAKRRDDVLFHGQLGEVGNAITTARIALESMVRLVNNFDFPATPQLTSEILSRKTIAARAVVDAATKALGAVGGAGYYRANALERLVRDALAGQFHPFPERRQQVFSGRIALGLDPPGEAYDAES